MVMTMRTQYVDGFASNLVVTTIGCMTDLSTDEIIMNNEVKLPEESDFPKMHLVVIDDNDNHIESLFKYEPSSTETELRLAFINPYKGTDEGRDLGDIQFVMEVGVVGGAIEEDSPSPASFTHGGAIGCDGNKRVSASLRDFDGYVKLRINDPTSKVRVWAGWATGQESVRLVPDLILEPSNADAADSALGEVIADRGTIDVDVKSKDRADDDTAATLKDESSNEEESREGSKKTDSKTKPRRNPLSSSNVHPELSNIAENAREMMEDRIKHKLADNANSNDREVRVRGDLKGKHDLDLAQKVGSTDRQRMPRDIVEEVNQPPRHQKDRKIKDIKTLQEEERKHRRDLEAQMEKNFMRLDNSADLDMFSYGIGCGFFIVSMGAIILVFGKKREAKGRRDL